jgi:hypothetical protein
MDTNTAIKRMLGRSTDTAKRHEVYTRAMADINGLSVNSLTTIGQDTAFVATLDADTLRKLVEKLAEELSSSEGARVEASYYAS